MVEIHGIIGNLLDFGDVHVQTAGESRELIIRGVAQPNNLRDFISSKLDILYRGHYEPGVANPGREPPERAPDTPTRGMTGPAQ